MQLLTGHRWVYLATAIFLSQAPPGNCTAAGPPLCSHNHSPFVQIYGLPDAQPARVLTGHEVTIRVTADVANSCTYFQSTVEDFWMDGESASFRFSSRIGVGHGLELGLSLPYLTHNPGILDEAISRWHSLTGLPQGRRSSNAEQQLLYRYRAGKQVQFELNRPVSGVGDLLILGGWQIRPSAPALTVRIGLKVPTGRPPLLTGSGSADGLLVLSAGGNWRPAGLPLRYSASLGVLRTGPSTFFRAVQRPVVTFGNIGVGITLLKGVTLLGQFDVHSPFYRSDAYQLGLPSAQLSLGGVLQVWNGYSLEVGLSEDVAVGTATDVDLNCSVQKMF